MGIAVTGGASGTTIGGTTASARNIISGNLADGIEFFADSGLANVVEGNFIGTDITGTVALGNINGVQVDNGSVGATIGGTAAGAGNLISGNVGTGITL
jgi:titin